ncbi:hypothetical protein [Leifsonia sp. Leaf264]|uniref:hypothetical protein n=1 Tax=Leifsonia sp. Leaf264 TaxID=1736314 RepID=UPI0006F22016|nr:hypothetical protein [Leifsonia sp. Leaf264]KQO97674.1 hypothetical protein ASF30_14800 [Leifsonia sp. Leaf264]
MNSSWNQNRHRAAEATDLLSEVLSDANAPTPRLISAYLDAKRQLALAFQQLAEDSFEDDGRFAELKTGLEATMGVLFPQVPLKYRTVRGYGRTHALLYAYLCARQGEEVSVDELRVLTGDAIHTERRTRELRGLGLRIDAYSNGGLSIYLLRDSHPAAHQGALVQVKRNIREDKTVDEQDRRRLLASLD